jgi:large subunit ribosomal protein L15
MPLYRRIPKRGFKCINSKDIVAINLSLLNSVFNDGDVVSIDALQKKGLVSNVRDGVKILGNGELTKKLTVQVNYFSASAKEKIEAAGGKAEVI